jgi:light-regulated signal transduction histidine kinase (bacteriophytochrome)
MTRVEMEQLIRHLSHEVKNPLTTLKGYAQLASLKKSDPEFIDKALGILQSQIERIEKMFNDLYEVFFYHQSAPSECNIESIINKNSESIASSAVSVDIRSDFSVKTDEKLFSILLSLLISDFDWKTHPNARCTVSSSKESGIGFVLWDFEGVDFSDIRKKIFYMPFAEKNYFPSGITLYKAFCIADVLGFAFSIDPVKNRFILEMK